MRSSVSCRGRSSSRPSRRGGREAPWWRGRPTWPARGRRRERPRVRRWRRERPLRRGRGKRPRRWRPAVAVPHRRGRTTREAPRRRSRRASGRGEVPRRRRAAARRRSSPPAEATGRPTSAVRVEPPASPTSSSHRSSRGWATRPTHNRRGPEFRPHPSSLSTFFLHVKLCSRHGVLLLFPSLSQARDAVRPAVRAGRLRP
mmetsp:Transcript_12846/g.37742  ORF Transcript_12846/g.37742 Transcript_12846/m.37742 type:complete len:201 (+) Transcript_12846:402-1004(+)